MRRHEGIHGNFAHMNTPQATVSRVRVKRVEKKRDPARRRTGHTRLTMGTQCPECSVCLEGNTAWQNVEGAIPHEHCAGNVRNVHSRVIGSHTPVEREQQECEHALIKPPAEEVVPRRVVARRTCSQHYKHTPPHRVCVCFFSCQSLQVHQT
jgi:hypothetical protein